MVKLNEHSAHLKRQILVKIMTFLCPKIVMDMCVFTVKKCSNFDDGNMTICDEHY
jgi:hypothetical protein